MRPLRIVVLIGLASGVAGCVLPPAFTIASFAADGFSLAFSHKTVTDHAISLLAQRDCRLWRLVQGKPICGADTSVVAVAALPPPLPLRAASRGFAPPTVIAAAAPAAPATEPKISTATADVPATANSEPEPEKKAPPPPPPLSQSPSPSPPASASSTIATSAPASATPRPASTRSPAVPAHQAVSPSIVPAQPASPPVRHASAGGESRVRGEMIIRSGTDEAEARALADSLQAVGAFIRPVRHGDIVVYEVVMGLSG